MEREVLFLDGLAVATAVHNAGGLVIGQVKRIADAAAFRPKEVKILGVLVDCVVVSTPEHHHQSWGTQYPPAMRGELRVAVSSIPPLGLSERNLIARCAAMELRPNAAVNLDIGMPEGVASVGPVPEEYMMKQGSSRHTATSMRSVLAAAMIVSYPAAPGSGCRPSTTRLEMPACCADNVATSASADLMPSKMPA